MIAISVSFDGWICVPARCKLALKERRISRQKGDASHLIIGTNLVVEAFEIV
jgi:hypothetical protein